MNLYFLDPEYVKDQSEEENMHMMGSEYEDFNICQEDLDKVMYSGDFDDVEMWKETKDKTLHLTSAKSVDVHWECGQHEITQICDRKYVIVEKKSRKKN